MINLSYCLYFKRLGGEKKFMAIGHKQHQDKSDAQHKVNGFETASNATPRPARRVSLGIAILGAAGLWLGFPNPLLQVPAMALLYPLALLELGRTAPSWRRAFRNGLGCGILGCSACLYWISVPIHDFGYLPQAAEINRRFPISVLDTVMLGEGSGQRGGGAGDDVEDA